MTDIADIVLSLGGALIGSMTAVYLSRRQRDDKFAQKMSSIEVELQGIKNVMVTKQTLNNVSVSLEKKIDTVNDTVNSNITNRIQNVELNVKFVKELIDRLSADFKDANKDAKEDRQTVQDVAKTLERIMGAVEVKEDAWRTLKKR